jgi:hypothetical protein
LTIIFSRAFPKMQPVYGRHHCAASSRLMASRNFASISFCRSTEMILPPPISRT